MSRNRRNSEDDIIGSRGPRRAPDLGPLFGTPPDDVDRMRHPVKPPGIPPSAKHIGTTDPVARESSLPYVDGSDTSKAAAQRHRSAAATQRLDVFAYILSVGPRGTSRREVGQALKLDSSSSTPRVLELIELREVVELQEKRDGRHIIIAADYAPQCPICEAGNPARGTLSPVCNRCKMKADAAAAGTEQ